MYTSSKIIKTLLRDQDEVTLRRLEQAARWYFCPEGGLVFDHGDTGDDVCFVVRGSVRTVEYAESGQRVAFTDVHACEFFGEHSAIDGEPRSAMMYALEDSVLAVVPGATPIQLMRGYPDVARLMVAHLVKTIRALNNRIVSLSSTTVLRRVYEKILDISKPDPMNPQRRIIELLPPH